MKVEHGRFRLITGYNLEDQITWTVMIWLFASMLLTFGMLVAWAIDFPLLNFVFFYTWIASPFLLGVSNVWLPLPSRIRLRRVGAKPPLEQNRWEQRAFEDDELIRWEKRFLERFPEYVGPLRWRPLPEHRGFVQGHGWPWAWLCFLCYRTIDEKGNGREPPAGWLWERFVDRGTEAICPDCAQRIDPYGPRPADGAFAVGPHPRVLISRPQRKLSELGSRLTP